MTFSIPRRSPRERRVYMLVEACPCIGDEGGEDASPSGSLGELTDYRL